MPIFRFPFFYNQNYNRFISSTTPHFMENKVKNPVNNEIEKKNNSKSKDTNENYFFELFGLKLYFDDILLLCLLFFLYQEGVKDDELFLSLVLLLLS